MRLLVCNVVFSMRLFANISFLSDMSEEVSTLKKQIGKKSKGNKDNCRICNVALEPSNKYVVQMWHFYNFN